MVSCQPVCWYVYHKHTNVVFYACKDSSHWQLDLCFQCEVDCFHFAITTFKKGGLFIISCREVWLIFWLAWKIVWVYLNTWIEQLCFEMFTRDYSRTTYDRWPWWQRTPLLRPLFLKPFLFCWVVLKEDCFCLIFRVGLKEKNHFCLLCRVVLKEKDHFLLDF